MQIVGFYGFAALPQSRGGEGFISLVNFSFKYFNLTTFILLEVLLCFLFTLVDSVSMKKNIYTQKISDLVVQFSCFQQIHIHGDTFFFRVIPCRHSRPAAYRLYLELLKRHAFMLRYQINGLNYKKWVIYRLLGYIAMVLWEKTELLIFCLVHIAYIIWF